MTQNKSTPVAIIMGSDSDLEVMNSCVEQLKTFDIKPEEFGDMKVTVTAHNYYPYRGISSVISSIEEILASNKTKLYYMTDQSVIT